MPSTPLPPMTQPTTLKRPGAAPPFITHAQKQQLGSPTCSGCGCCLPGVFLQLLHWSKSGHCVQRQPWPGAISRLHVLQVQAKAGSLGLCRW